MAKITSSVFSLPTAFVASAPWSCPTNLCLSSYSFVSVWACITPRRSHLPSVLGHYTTWTASAALMHPFIHLKKHINQVIFLYKTWFQIVFLMFGTENKSDKDAVLMYTECTRNIQSCDHTVMFTSWEISRCSLMWKKHNGPPRKSCRNKSIERKNWPLFFFFISLEAHTVSVLLKLIIILSE